MKKSIFTLFVFAIGMAAGGYGGHFFTVLKYADKTYTMVRVYDEGRMLADGTNALSAYLHEPVEVGIFELRSHLNELDKRAAWARSNLVVINNKDINWMRAVAHVRLANLYSKRNQMGLSSNHMDAAWQTFSLIEGRVKGVTNRNDLVRCVQEADKKESWW